MSFNQYNAGKLHIDYISQQPTFRLDKSTCQQVDLTSGQRSDSTSQTVLQDQASSVSMNQSAYIAGQSSVLNLRSNQISSVSAAHLMCRSDFLPTMKTQSKVPSICPARLSDIKTHSNTHAARLIMSSASGCTCHPAIWNCE